MEREVEEKIAQLAVLEQENRQLKWQAHILENMLLDMDKQVRSASPSVGAGRKLQGAWQAGLCGANILSPAVCKPGASVCLTVKQAACVTFGPCGGQLQGRRCRPCLPAVHGTSEIWEVAIDCTAPSSCFTFTGQRC
jgi:hypothetical protein